MRFLSKSVLLCVSVLLLYIPYTGCIFAAKPKTPSPPQYVHADFLVTKGILLQLIQNLPSDIQEQIIRVPQYFLELLSQAIVELPADLMQLVDKDHPLDATYVPHDLVALDAYRPILTLTRENMLLSEQVVPDLLAMNAELARMGMVVRISSTYRSYQYQDAIYARSVQAYGQEYTDESVARAGHSQHQLGSTIDFGSISDEFGGTPVGQWLLENGWKFGFSLSYPKGHQHETGYKYESWHYRYIGRAASHLVHRFFNDRQQLFMTYLHFQRATIEALLLPTVVVR